MSAESSVVQLLAKLVHRGLVSADDARVALATEDVAASLAERGVCSPSQWREWVETDGGDRPKLSRYELGELLGEGGQARVFAAVDRVDQRNVALKVFRHELSKDTTAVQGFIAEAKLLLELEHEHIVRGYRVAREGPVIFFAMERVAGRSLLELLNERGRLDEDLALEVVRQVAEGLACLQARGLVHRDVKPGNVLWDDSARRAVLIDLGFAVGDRGGPEVETASTTSGTVHYISPEQARGRHDLDVRADIYSLGATLYHLVCGALPFSGADGQEVLAKQVLESLSGRRIRELELSPQVHWLIEKMMAKEKEIRFQSAEELASAIANVEEQKARARKVAELDAEPDPVRRRRGTSRSTSRRRRRR